MDDDIIDRFLGIHAEHARAEREDDEFRDENVPSLTVWRDTKVPQPEEGEPFLTIDYETGRVTFRDQDALDEYVREAKEADRD